MNRQPEFIGELPPRRFPGRGPSTGNPLVEALKARPGEWARIREFANNAAGATGHRLRNQGCETAMRTIDGKHWLFARWPEVQS